MQAPRSPSTPTPTSGAVMAAYNRVNGQYAGGNHALLNDVLKVAWGYRGWVMSDWGATPSWEFALNGLDQESGAQIDALLWQAEAFTDRLKVAYAEGKLSRLRLSDMVRRILRSIFTVGADQWDTVPAPDIAAHHRIALQIARQGTGNPVAMPWRDAVNAIVQAWYPGQAGGQAIAEVIAGRVNPSGRLPITFPLDLGQTPRPEPPGLGDTWGSATTICYTEGADVGYRWFAKQARAPMFAFGHGLSYTDFEHRDLTVAGGETVTASFTVVNTGDRAGADIRQLYLTAAAGDRRMRLLGFERVYLEPVEFRRVTIEGDPRLLARYDGAAGSWRIVEGSYAVAVGASAAALDLTAEVKLAGRVFGR
jgi:Glycosyl hydrolase family 3 C-terminal domain/Fibronectin type III-like domain/Glycosyl hydrolase family 3 N terminal domain